MSDASNCIRTRLVTGDDSTDRIWPTPGLRDLPTGSQTPATRLRGGEHAAVSGPPVDGKLPRRLGSKAAVDALPCPTRCFHQVACVGRAERDRVGMNLDDGAALTAFQVRRRGSGVKLYAYASLREAGSAKARVFGADEVDFAPVERWTSPRTRGVWPVAQRVRVGPRTFETKPLFADQELDSRASTGAVYWEGASLLLEGGRRVGRGYLEMTGYVEPIRL